MSDHSLQTQRRFGKALEVSTKGNQSYDIAAGAKSISANIPLLVHKLIAVAEAEEQLLDLLADAVERGNHDDVFLLASQLTKIFPPELNHAQHKEKQVK